MMANVTKIGGRLSCCPSRLPSCDQRRIHTAPSMGCKPSKDGDRASGSSRTVTGEVQSTADLPQVPEDSWYAQPFTEHSTTDPCAILKDASGLVLRSKHCIPTKDGDMNRFFAEGKSLSEERFHLGVDPIFCLGVPFSTALHIEHSWRLRVKNANNHDEATRTARPFYDTVIGIRVLVNGGLVPAVPDAELPTDAQSSFTLPNSTATYPVHDSVCQWRYVPIVLFPPLDHFTVTMSTLYWPLIIAFCRSVITLTDGLHQVRLEVVYGSKQELFVTDFIAEGEFQLNVTRSGVGQCLSLMEGIEQRLRDCQLRTRNQPASSDHLLPLPTKVAPSIGPCPACQNARRFCCVFCSAPVCGMPSCVRRPLKAGYPCACKMHRPAKEITAE